MDHAVALDESMSEPDRVLVMLLGGPVSGYETADVVAAGPLSALDGLAQRGCGAALLSRPNVLQGLQSHGSVGSHQQRRHSSSTDAVLADMLGVGLPIPGLQAERYVVWPQRKNQWVRWRCGFNVDFFFFLFAGLWDLL